ncbi:MAG TPA: hypothetical protein VGA29_02590 [Ignavibacteriaceae bacterium]
MITQIKRRGGSLIIVLDPVFAKFHELKEDDWLNISDAYKVVKKEKEND